MELPLLRVEPVDGQIRSIKKDTELSICPYEG